MKKLQKAIQPLLTCNVSLKKQRLAIHEMFSAAVSNAPENEIDNYTAKKLSPVYLALMETLENIRKVSKKKNKM